VKGYHISFIRHGMTETNESGVYCGITDVSLSKAGKEQLQNSYDEYEYPKVERVYSSPLKRCTETSCIIFPEREIITLNGFSELNFGDFENRHADDLVNIPEFKTWLEGGLDVAPPNGESVRQLIERAFEAVSRVIREMMREEFRHVAVITHSGVISNLLACFGLPKYDPKAFFCNYGEGFEVMVTAQMWQQANAFEILGKVPEFRQ
jgi:alpha-ribazole phosphatase